MNITDCIEIPAGIIAYLLGEARSAARNAVDVNTHLVREAVTGASTVEERVQARASALVACDHMQTIIDALQKIIDGAES